MTPVRFGLCAVVALLFFAAFNVAVGAITRRQPLRQKIESLRVAPRPDPLFLGNSTMEAGLSESVYAHETPGAAPLNRAIGGTGTVEHLLMLKTALKSHPSTAAKPLTVVYGIFDLMLTHPPKTDAVGGTRAMAYYVEPDTALRYLAPTLPDKLAFEMTRFLPALREKYALWAQVEKARRRVESVGLKPQAEDKTNVYGRAADFAQLEAASTLGFANECRQALTAAKTSGTLLNAPIREFLDTARANQVRLILVMMPLPEKHRQRFFTLSEWQAYRAALRAELTARHVVLIDASDWVADQSPTDIPRFADAVHLAPPGAALFTRRLAQEIKRLQQGRIVP